MIWILHLFGSFNVIEKGQPGMYKVVSNLWYGNRRKSFHQNEKKQINSYNKSLFLKTTHSDKIHFKCVEKVIQIVSSFIQNLG